MVQPLAITLAAGQTLQLHARLGTRIVATRGSIRIVEQPVWLAEQWLEQSELVRDGEQHLIRRSGWVALRAQQAATLLCIAPAKKKGVITWLRRFFAIAAVRSRRVSAGKPT